MHGYLIGSVAAHEALGNYWVNPPEYDGPDADELEELDYLYSLTDCEPPEEVWA